MKRAFSLLFVSAILAGGTFAQDATPETAKKRSSIAKRKENQQDRIAKGVESGSLTAAEAAKLETKEARLNRQIRKDRKDGGGLTARERARIQHKQDKLSRGIAKEKHDKQDTK